MLTNNNKWVPDNDDEEEQDSDDEAARGPDADQIAERRAMGLDRDGERLNAPAYYNDDPYDQPDGPDFEYDEGPEEEEQEDEE